MKYDSISVFIIPLVVIGIVGYGYFKKINIYDSFVNGAKEGLGVVFNIFPSILAMIFAVNIFFKSGALDIFSFLLEPILAILKIPLEIIPMAILRPISGSASLAILNDIFRVNGVDSFVGILSSVIQGSNDTTLYILALYFGSIKVSKTKHALAIGLFADFLGVVVALIIVKLLFT